MSNYLQEKHEIYCTVLYCTEQDKHLCIYIYLYIWKLKEKKYINYRVSIFQLALNPFLHVAVRVRPFMLAFFFLFSHCIVWHCKWTSSTLADPITFNLIQLWNWLLLKLAYYVLSLLSCSRHNSKHILIYTFYTQCITMNFPCTLR